MPPSVPPPPPSETDPVVSSARTHGFTTETLPALRQYRAQREIGNMEAAERIGDNLLAFLEEQQRGTP